MWMSRCSSSPKPDLFDLARMQTELAEILGHQVDLVERSAIEKSRNYIRRKAIQKVYATR